MVTPSTMAKLEDLARRLGSTPADVVDLLASRELREHPGSRRQGSKRRSWSAARVVEEIAARADAGKLLNHSVVIREHPRLVSSAREFFGGWDEALAAAGEKRPPPHRIPELRGLRRWRLARGYTQAALSARADVAQGQISAYENGKALPTEGSARALAKALAVELSELFQG